MTDSRSDTPRTDHPETGYRAHYAEHEHNRELCRQLERELAQARQAAARQGGQAVAWRWRPKGGTIWIYNPDLEWLGEQSLDAIEKEPLYAAPPVAAGWRDTLRKLANEAFAIAEMARPCIGHTNAAVLHQRIQEAEALLAAAPSREENKS